MGEASSCITAHDAGQELDWTVLVVTDGRPSFENGTKGANDWRHVLPEGTKLLVLALGQQEDFDGSFYRALIGQKGSFFPLIVSERIFEDIKKTITDIVEENCELPSL